MTKGEKKNMKEATMASKEHLEATSSEEVGKLVIEAFNEALYAGNYHVF